MYCSCGRWSMHTWIECILHSTGITTIPPQPSILQKRILCGTIMLRGLFSKSECKVSRAWESLSLSVKTKLTFTRTHEKQHQHEPRCGERVANLTDAFRQMDLPLLLLAAKLKLYAQERAKRGTKSKRYNMFKGDVCSGKVLHNKPPSGFLCACVYERS